MKVLLDDLRQKQKKAETYLSSDDRYGIYTCQKHQITIYYFRKENSFAEYKCWDCLRERNLK